jgi:hypothetical protein
MSSKAVSISKSGYSTQIRLRHVLEGILMENILKNLVLGSEPSAPSILKSEPHE